jgi:hypothetical protein
MTDQPIYKINGYNEGEPTILTSIAKTHIHLLSASL